MYVISVNDHADAYADSSFACPVSSRAIQGWLNARPELRLDGKRPSASELADRIAGFWIPDEVILYVGLAGTSLRTRVRQYLQTPLGARRPHAGGHFLKTLSNLGALSVYWAATSESKGAEQQMLAAFVENVSDRSRDELVDPDHPFPFANLEWPPGTRKRHGLTGTKGDVAGPRSAHQDASKLKAGAEGRRKSGLRLTLHAEVERILRENGNTWTTTEAVAQAVNDAGHYLKKDGSPVTSFQIHGRTRNYSQLFERDGSRVRLRSQKPARD